MSQKIIHITDIHIAPEGDLVVGMDPRLRLAQVIRSINQNHHDADMCVISGDLTDRGDIASYRLVKTHLQELRVPYRLMLGNHDNRAAFRDIFPEASIDPKGWVHSVVDLGELRLILLDTLDDNRADTGILCTERLAWLAERLQESATRRVMVFMHHPPKSVGVKWFDNMMLEQPDEFLALVAKHPSVAHIAFGHLHLTTTGRWGNVSFSCNRGTCHRITLCTDADVIEFVDGEPTYDVILVDDTGVIVHHTAPVESGSLIAREYPTTDGKGRIVYVRDLP